MTKKNIILTIIIIVFSICLYLFSLNADEQLDEARKQENEEFPSIEKSKTDYCGYVLRYSRSKVFGGRVFNLELNNGDKFAIWGSIENSKYKKKELTDNLLKGDSIYYNHKTYEFYIHKKDGIKLYFKLFNSIN